MALYTVSRSNVTPSVGNDLITVISPANRRIRVVEVSVSGLHTSSAAQEVSVARSTAGTTPGGAITPDKVETDSIAAASTTATTWAVQPTIGTNPLKLGFNALGGAYRWVARSGTEITARNADNISVRAAVGTNPMSVHITFEEY